MAQRTRTPRADQRVRAPGGAGYVVGGLVLVGGAWLALTRGAGPGAVVLTAVVGVAVGTAVLQLPRRWGLPALVLAFVAGAGVLARADRAATAAWIGGVVLGLVVGLQLVWNRQRRAAGAVPGTPTARRDGDGVRLVGDDGPDDVETSDPGEDDVRRAAQALDGRTRTGLSVFRGTARLDLGGDAAGALVVLQCDDTSARRPVWWVVAGDTAAGARGAVDVRVAGLDAHLPAAVVTSAGPALTAVQAFLRTGGRAPGLPWRTEGDVDELTAPFDRWS